MNDVDTEIGADTRAESLPDETISGRRLRPLLDRARRVTAVASVAGAFGLGIVVGGGLPNGPAAVTAESSLTGSPEFKTLEDTWELIHEQWPLPEELDDATLIYGAAQGMVDAIGDEGHSVFLDPEMTIVRAEESAEAFVGIGVEVTARCGVPAVISTVPGSPAEGAGLLPGDIIAEVDGESTRRMDLNGLRDAILGNEGDALTLTIERPGEENPMTIDVTRDTIERRPVTWHWLPDKTVHLRLTGFEPGVNLKLRGALQSIVDEGAERLILDLRGNPGGMVPEVIGVASQFLDEGLTVFQEQGREGEPRALKTVGRSGLWQHLPLVVLIDGESASGAEVLAAALRDNGRATLIGETTFGTGTVLSTFPQEDGSSIMLGTSFWLTPSGEHIWRQGVDPDELVSLAPDAFPARPEDDPVVTLDELAQLDDGQLQAAFAALEGAPAGDALSGS